MDMLLWLTIAILVICLILIAIVIVKALLKERKDAEAITKIRYYMDADVCYTNSMNETQNTNTVNMGYPNTLSRALHEINQTEHYSINDILESFQFLYSEVKLSQMITWTMRNNVVTMLKENDAKVWNMPVRQCGYEVTLTSDNESDSAYCGYPHAHAGTHGNWRK